ncbi:MAG: hypothetical protein Fues2KO_53130 [Fuerstiella sp.]
MLADSVTINRPLILAGTLSVADGEQAVWAGPVTGSGTDAALNVGSLVNLNVSGDICSSSGFTKQGDGALSLTGSANSVGGTTLLSDGNTLLEGNDLVDGPVTVANGATLTAQGCLPGSVTIQSGGNLTPGDGVVILQTGDLDLQSGSTLNMQVAGIETAGTDFDQLDVVGSVTLAGALNLLDTSAATGQVNDRITLIRNDGNDAVDGTFSNLAQSASVTLNGETWRILYNGGDGNDVELVFGTPLVTVGDVSITEADSGTVNATFSVTVDSPLGSAFRVSFETAHSSTSADDFTASSGTLSFDGLTAGKTQVVTVNVSGDEVVELDESFFLNLTGILDTNVVTSADQQAVGTITNDDAAAFSIDDVTVVEGDAGDTSATLTVTLNEAVDTALALNFATQDTTAVAGTDYTDGSGTLNFAGQKGETQTISIDVSGDELVELNETLQVNLSGLVAHGRSVSITDAAGEASISNDDAVTVSILDAEMLEGDEGYRNMVFRVSMDGAVNTMVRVDAATADDTAVAGEDYTASQSTLVFPAGMTPELTFVVRITGDTAAEPDERLLAQLSNISAGSRAVTFADAEAVGTIRDTDPRPASLSLDGATGFEVAESEILLTVTTPIPVQSDQFVGVNFSGTDVTSSDYRLSTDRIRIPAGQTSGTATLTVLNDDIVELTESATVELVDPTSGLQIQNGSRTLQLVSDDAANVAIADLTLTEGDAGTTTARFAVTLEQEVGTEFQLNFTTADDSATAADADYQSQSGQLNFTGTAAEVRYIDVAVNGDETVETDESFQVLLSNLQAGGRPGRFAQAGAIGTIINDDMANNINLSADSTTGTERDGTMITVTPDTTEPVNGDQSVTLSISGPHITSSDYRLSQQPLIIPDGLTTASASFTVLQDGMLEGSETATVTLVNPSQDLTIGNNASVTLTIADDTPIHINSTGNFPGSQPTISLQAVPAAVRYEVWFARVFPSQQRIYSDTEVTDTQWAVPDELTPGFYRYWVRAIDQHDHVGRWSSSQAFEVRPTLLGPLKPTFDGTPTFSWEPIAHTPGYQLFIRTREGDMVQNNLTETSWTPDEALPYGQIRWWIRPSDAIQNRGWSLVGSTNVARRAQIESVSVSSDGRPTFAWQDVEGVRHHSIYVQNLTTGELAFRRDRVQGTTYTHNSSLSSGTFRVWVKTIGENLDHGSGRWSCFVDFTVTSTEQESDELLAESFGPQLTSLPTETAAGSRKDEGVRSTESTAEAVSYSAEVANDAAGTGRPGETTTQTAATPSGGLVVESEQAAVAQAKLLDKVLAKLAISGLAPSGI